MQVAADAEPTTPITAQPLGKYWLFRGPAAYVPLTPWGPLSGSIAAVIVFLGAVLAVGTVLLMAHALGSRDEVLLNIVGTLAQQGAMIALTFYAASRFGGRVSAVLALRAPAQGPKAYPAAFALLIALALAMSATLQALDAQSLKGDMQVFQPMLQSRWWWLTFVLVGIGAPLSEELLCRGFLFSALAKSRLGNWGAALVSSAAFASVHFYSPLGMLLVFMIGMLLAWVLIRTGSLRVTMVCHALYNTLLATLMVTGSLPQT